MEHLYEIRLFLLHLQILERNKNDIKELYFCEAHFYNCSNIKILEIKMSCK